MTTKGKTMATTETFKVYSSKTGVLHVASKVKGSTVYTFGTWKGAKVSGACRSLDITKLKLAGNLSRVDVNNEWIYTYYPEAAE